MSMMWKWLRRLAVVYIVAEFFITPDAGLIQSHAQGACTVTGAPGGALGTTNPSLATMTSNEVLIKGGCIDGVAIGQNTPVTAITTTTETVTGNQTATGALNNFGTSTSAPAHLTTGQTTAPAVTACGTGSPSVVGTDTAGTITMGTSASGCTLTFNVAYTGVPFCSVDWQTNIAAMAYTVSNSAITITQTATSGNLITYICIGTAGG